MKARRFFRRTMIPATLAASFLLFGCASRQPSPPAQVWGGVGFAYQAEKISGGKSKNSPRATTHIGFEKQLGHGLGIGAEVAGDAK